MNGSRTSSGQFKLTTKTAAIVGVSALGVAGLLGVTIWITAHISGGGSGTGAGSGGGGKAPGAAPAAKNVNPPAPLDDAAREARQRALAQIPESSGTVAPVEALRRVPISLPPPAAAGGRVTAPPTPVKLDVPSGTPVTPARPGTPATPANPGGGVRPPPPPTPGGAALPANDPNAPLPLELALHPSLYTDVNKVAARLAPVTLGGTSATVSATPTTADPQEKLRLEAIRLEKARQFVMSMCLDQQGRIWVGCENTQPGDGTGGIQVFTPGAPRFQEWKQYTVKDGLGDDNGYAVACDLQGRIWAGHLNHGVSVFNGERWQTYEVVGGLSRPDTLNGPLGERIFHITVCPATATGKFKDSLTDKESAVAGSVWMCTSAGLSIYFPSTDTWSYLTRADGLPSDQANSLAFDKEGMVFVANQCDGISIASPADGYKSWKQVARRLNGSQDGPLTDELPTTPTGEGLPTNLMNDILVAKDGTVYAATTAGLAWSFDKGNTWQFVKGGEAEATSLREDYCTCLAEDYQGHIWIGHRQAASEVWQTPAIVKALLPSFTRAIVPNGVATMGNYGDGLVSLSAQTPAPVFSHQTVSSMPTEAAIPSLGTFHRLSERINAAESAALAVLYANEDWTTRGDWIGRYGFQLACLCGAGGGSSHFASWGNAYAIVPSLGPQHTKDDTVRGWIASLSTQDPRAIYNPLIHARMFSEFDDHGEGYKQTQEGPDLWLSIRLPEGGCRLSLYFVNDDGHDNRDRFRDFSVQICVGDRDGRPLARSRVTDFWGGVYKQFYLSAPGNYSVRIARNHSLNTTVAAVFVDRLPLASGRDVRAAPGMDGVLLLPPRYSPIGDLPEPSSLTGAKWAWDTAFQTLATPEVLVAKRLALRAAASCNNQAQLANWRWACGLWSPADRLVFRNAIAMGGANIKQLSSRVEK